MPLPCERKNMKKKTNDNATSKVVITVLSVLCTALIVLSAMGTNVSAPVRNVTGFIVTPVQKGISSFGTWLSSLTGNFTDSASLREENATLKSQVEALTAENSQLVLDKEELARLQELLSLKESYSDYETTAARVISKGTGNWYSTFTIDKGTKDGVQVDSNVLTGSGLVGIVTEAGPNWATVRAIIDDDSNVSSMVSTTQDTCIIAGNLQLIDSGTLSLVKLSDENNRVHVGDKVVTSNISQKYLPGILIGYITSLDNDANNLTKSGEITPVVDFKHIQEVLVTLKTKQTISDDSAAPAEEEPVQEEAAQEEPAAEEAAGDQTQEGN